MEKIKEAADLVVGKLYSDRDGVTVLIYRGASGFLYDFEATEYDEEKGDFIGTGEEIRLTAREIRELYTY